MNASLQVSFDGWLLNSSTGELRKGELRVRLPVQSALVLEELVTRPGELVTREWLIAKLWPRGVVDYDTALNTIVHRLRVALGDRADQPKYIETIPRRGYRFIGQVGPVPDPPTGADPVVESRLRLPLRTAASRPSGAARPGRIVGAAVAAVLVMSIAAGGAFSTLTDQFDARAPMPAAAGSDSVGERLARAQFLMQRREPGDVASARRSFMEAIAEEPGNAEAWAGLAGTHWLDVVEGRATDAHGIPLVIEAAERAIELEPRLAEAHFRLAQGLCRRGERAVADTHLQRALASEPDNPLVLSAGVEQALAAERLAEAVELQRRAVTSDPLAIASRQNLFVLLMLAGRFDEAAVENERLRELSPSSAWYWENRVELLLLQRRFDDALSVAQQLERGPGRSFYEAVANHGLGRHEEADAGLRALIRSAGREEQSRVAEALAILGKRVEALEALQQGDCGSKNWVRYSPFLRSLHGDPRWQAWLGSTSCAGAS